ncbi:hypothetical protein JHK82_012465 [Glycine max]|uniref:Uncharacterized protein n=2 Tax=Glycine subgen. Soja TaxID=1462606 RepID=K7KPA6_SOYBN|nr:hypothetical protein JHK87_012378 [Glycine soja]KAG5040344.1 hypothetical protein JHK85_012820 [Glycine max]KAG5057490.1 hypothetical protein JHK86_012486 [Glycine max]KAG5154496.1 hypothetical protein JHK82_012465 [Glycine max]KAH1133650.1 hypothetical protein GYH30_012177 [Glycine max]
MTKKFSTLECPHRAFRSFREYGEVVLKHLENSIGSDPSLLKAPVNYEGVRVSGYGGWFLLRLSLHDHVLPLNIEVKALIASLGRKCITEVDLEYLSIFTLYPNHDPVYTVGVSDYHND